MPGERDYYRDAENIILNFVNANDEITIYVSGTGTETDSVKYLNKGTLGTGLAIRPSATVNLVQLGSKVYRNPMTISTAGLSWTENVKDFNIVVLRATSADTLVEVLIT